MTPELARFKKTLIYSRRAPIDALLVDLAELRAYDRAQERYLTLWTALGGVCLIGAGLAIYGIRSQPTSPYLAPVPWVLGVLSAVSFAIRIARGKYNLENRRYELTERVLGFLRRDSRPDAEILLEVDFRRPNVKAKRVREKKVGPWDVKYYFDCWLQVRGRLLDGTAYRFSAIEKHQDRRKTYKASSGKIKTKSKSKSATQLSLGLKVKTRRFPLLPVVNKLAKDARETVQLPEWVALKACRIHAPEGAKVGTLILKSVTKQSWSCAPADMPEGPDSGVRWFAMTFLSLYQVLSLARPPKKKA